MTFKGKNGGEVNIPAWAIIFGGLILDNVITNFMRLKAYNKTLEAGTKEE